MKSIYKTLIGIAFFILLPYISIACEITVNVDGVNKQKYKAGDVVILKINVKKSHRNCSVDIKETKIQVSGMQIIAATEWVNTEGRRGERKMKIKIGSDKDDKAILEAKRTCDKDGGSGSLVLQKEPVS